MFVLFCFVFLAFKIIHFILFLLATISNEKPIIIFIFFPLQVKFSLTSLKKSLALWLLSLPPPRLILLCSPLRGGHPQATHPGRSQAQCLPADEGVPGTGTRLAVLPTAQGRAEHREASRTTGWANAHTKGRVCHAF